MTKFAYAIGCMVRLPCCKLGGFHAHPQCAGCSQHFSYHTLGGPYVQVLPEAVGGGHWAATVR